MLLASLLISIVAWILFTWPLPKYAASGIPASSRNPEHLAARYMVPGDHLQLLYRFWLFHDMLRGQTPFFHNVYEFNRGDDAETHKPGSYYAPFSLVYAVLAEGLNRASAWNITGLMSLWLTYLFTWMLANRYTREPWAAAIAALVGLLFPYRFENLLGGSPMGFAMMWVPILLYGIDVAVRDEEAWGGLVAGTALLFSCWTDTQLFFFSALLAPAWCVVALVYKHADFFFSWRAVRRTAVALSPVAVLGVIALIYTKVSKAELAESAHMADGRTMAEVALFSPRWADFFSWRDAQGVAQVYVGWTIPLLAFLAALTLIVTLIARRRRGRSVEIVTLLLLTAGITGILFLALGPNGPARGLFFARIRQLIPPYSMVRQPAKIFCILPTLLAVAGAISLGRLSSEVTRSGRILLALAAAMLMTLEYRSRIDPQICLLAADQQAYRAVAEDASQRGVLPRVLVLPLWPGDSHWASPYQHYASLYRIRMLNGYRPVISRDYYQNVFLKLRSLNAGKIQPDQLSMLFDMGIRYVLLHEDAFPEKVSPFPVAYTLKHLLNNPRLELLAQDERVWAFRILPADGPYRDPVAANWTTFPPARRFEAERSSRHNARTVEDPACMNAAYVELAEDGSTVQTRARGMTDAPGARWLIRVRGKGALQVSQLRGRNELSSCRRVINTSRWRWIDVPMPPLEDYYSMSLKLQRESGAVDVDGILLATMGWRTPAPSRSVTIPAPCFFHAGYTDLERDAVVFRALWDSPDRIFYGPYLPLEPGIYEVTLSFRSDAARGTWLGRWQVETEDPADNVQADVVAGIPCSFEFVQKANIPVTFSFTYAGQPDMTITGVTLTRRP